MPKKSKPPYVNKAQRKKCSWDKYIDAIEHSPLFSTSVNEFPKKS